MKTVLIARPQQQSQELAQKLASNGYNCIVAPSISIIPLAASSWQKSIENYLNINSLVIFTSQHAVNNFIPNLDQSIKNLLKNMQIFAIGHATLISLKSYNIAAKMPESGSSSEKLLDLLESQGKFNKKTANNVQINQQNSLNSSKISDNAAKMCQPQALIVSGVGGRELLQQSLVKHGFNVNKIECYKRIALKDFPNTVLKQIQEQPIHYVIASSNEVLTALTALLKLYKLSHVFDAQIIAFSERIIPLAKQQDFTKVPLVAANASNDVLITAIENAEQQGKL